MVPVRQKKSDRDTSNVIKNEMTYENILLEEVHKLDILFSENNTKYGIFGGLGTAAYLGQLPRRIIDIDIVILEKDKRKAITILSSSGYDLKVRPPFKHLTFSKQFGHKTFYLHCVIDPFVVYDNSTSLKLFSYSFKKSFKKLSRETIFSMKKDKSCQVWVLPIEDVIISKLLAPLEPSYAHDILYLLITEKINNVYFNERISDLPKNVFKMIIIRLKTLLAVTPHLIWTNRISDDQIKTLVNSITARSE